MHSNSNYICFFFFQTFIWYFCLLIWQCQLDTSSNLYGIGILTILILFYSMDDTIHQNSIYFNTISWIFFFEILLVLLTISLFYNKWKEYTFQLNWHQQSHSLSKFRMLFININTVNWANKCDTTIIFILNNFYYFQISVFEDEKWKKKSNILNSIRLRHINSIYSTHSYIAYGFEWIRFVQ